MKNRFPGYYRPSQDDFTKLWSACLFVPDTNILLHLFRYGEKTRAQVLDTLTRLKPRVWIPYRVGLEFHRRWREVDQTNRDAYDSLANDIQAQGRKLGGLFEGYTRHQTIDVKQEQNTIDDFIASLCKRLTDNKAKHPTHADAEQIFQKISDLIGDAVGDQSDSSEIEKALAEAQKRFDKGVPPGNRDSKKEGIDKFGDYFIWKEVLDKSKASNKPIIIITDDVKDDWWQEFRGAKIGPRPELVEEMLNVAGQKFYLYTLSQFLDYASTYLNQDLDSAAIEEIKSDELQQRAVARKISRNFVFPASISAKLISQLENRQRFLRRKRRELDAELSAITNIASGLELEKAQQILRERESTTSELRRITRELRNLHSSPNFHSIWNKENTKRTFDYRRAVDVIRNILEHDEMKETTSETIDETSAPDTPSEEED